jgi:hypothetical protein
MRLCPAHDNAVAAPFDDVDVEVGIGLRGGRQRTVAFHVRLRHRDRKIVRPAVAIEGVDATLVVAAVFRIERRGDPRQREQRVGADLLDQHDQRAPGGRGALDERTALQQVVAASRELVVARVLVLVFRDDRELALGRVVGQLIVDRRVPDGHADHRMGRDVGHALAAEIHRAIVLQALHILLNGSEWHGGAYNNASPAYERQRPLRSFRHRGARHRWLTRPRPRDGRRPW